MGETRIDARDRVRESESEAEIKSESESVTMKCPCGVPLACLYCYYDCKSDVNYRWCKFFSLRHVNFENGVVPWI